MIKADRNFFLMSKNLTLQGHPDAVSWQSKTIDYDKLSLVFGLDVANGQFA